MDMHGEFRNIFTILFLKSEEETPLGGPRYRWKDRINAVLEELGCVCVLDLSARRQTVGSCERYTESSDSI